MSKPRYAVLGEYRSDTDIIKVIIRKLLRRIMTDEQADSVPIKTQPYSGAGGLFANGARDLSTLAELDWNRFVVCHDADTDKSEAREKKVLDEIVRPSGITQEYCIVIPVQEIEAWIIADLNAVATHFTSWPLCKPFSCPEKITRPKEKLESLVKRPGKNKKSLYDHVNDNKIVAQHLCLDTVAGKCPSIRCLWKFVTGTAWQPGGKKLRRKKRKR